MPSHSKCAPLSVELRVRARNSGDIQKKKKAVPRPAKKDVLAKIENDDLQLFSLSSPHYAKSYLSPRSRGRPVQCSMAGGKYFTLPLQRKTLTNLSQCDRALLGPSHDNVHMTRVNHQSGMSKPHDRRAQLMH